MLGDITIAQEIYIACGYKDMRKSIDGLATLVQQQFSIVIVKWRIKFTDTQYIKVCQTHSFFGKIKKMKKTINSYISTNFDNKQ